MRRGASILAACAFVALGCAGRQGTQPEEYETVESHRSVLAGDIDYVYWESYLMQHGERDTFERLRSMIEAGDAADAERLEASFERFCRFEGCLESYRRFMEEKRNR